MQIGAARPAAKLDDEKVLAIRRLLSTDTPRSGLQRRLAEQYGVSQVTIFNVGRGVIWKHLPHVGDPALFDR